MLFVLAKAAMGEILRDDPVLAEQIAQVMAHRDLERQQLVVKRRAIIALPLNRCCSVSAPSSP
jgi:hypothetical protein